MRGRRVAFIYPARSPRAALLPSPTPARPSSSARSPPSPPFPPIPPRRRFFPFATLVTVLSELARYNFSLSFSHPFSILPFSPPLSHLSSMSSRLTENF